jgi:serine/threonine-protein kinase CHEK2
LEDVINEDDKVYLILELAAEGELFHYIVAKGMLSELESRRLLVQVA